MIKLTSLLTNKVHYFPRHSWVAAELRLREGHFAGWTNLQFIRREDVPIVKIELEQEPKE